MFNWDSPFIYENILPCLQYYTLLLFSDSCEFSVDFPSLPSYMSCQLSSSCTQVSCCMNVSSIGRSFEMKLNIDPCTYSLTVGIENFDNKELLFDFDWGVLQHFWLFGLVRLE